MVRGLTGRFTPEQNTGATCLHQVQQRKGGEAQIKGKIKCEEETYRRVLRVVQNREINE